MHHAIKLTLYILLASLSGVAYAAPLADWPSTEGAAGGGRYSPLVEINRDNVSKLEVAWTYRHGDKKSGGFLPDKVNRGTAFEGTPIMVDGRLIFTTPFNRVIALDPTTGEEKGVKGITNFGPSLVTAGGLVFHAGTREQSLRAHDSDTGEVLARFELPAGLHAGPVTYRVKQDGKQFLVVAPGGHIGLASKLGDYIIAYTLP